MSKAEQFRDLSDAELDARLVDLQKELFHLKNEIKKAKKAEKPHMLPFTRKEIARILTIQKERQLAINS